MSSGVRVQARYKISVSACEAFSIDAHVFIGMDPSVARASSSDSAWDDHNHEVSTRCSSLHTTSDVTLEVLYAKLTR